MSDMRKLNKCISVFFLNLLLILLISGCSPNGDTPTSPITVTNNLTTPSFDPTHERHPYQDIVNAVKALQPTEIPEHLLSYNCNRTFEEFDVNEYFTILTNISVKEGYTLDYVYCFDNSAGYPTFYIRKLSQKPYLNELELYEETGLLQAGIDRNIELQKNIMSGETLAWRNSIVINDTKQGFFEYLVLHIIGGQFYLWWHAGYNDLTFICDHSALQAVIEEVQKYYGMSEETISAAYKLDLSPEVEFKDHYVIITAVFFTSWGGFREGTFTISHDFPHIVINTEWKTLVEYDCGAVI